MVGRLAQEVVRAGREPLDAIVASSGVVMADITADGRLDMVAIGS